ncbi:PaaI family thioesterase [Tardiphaga sp. P9-11]|uniref:PaaI family thioesterase n=1 Tax=Tardiphaga sp. P9-11 TaxID=2024614 RepID=UPI0011F159A0|nr:PaaI family thioesterase [Tardiphaga sp. P9-11]KAA0070371.1 PaaI family thioesterase [Tardiphaga sp. P9-11]
MPAHSMQLTADELQSRLSRNHLANWMGLRVVHAAAGQIRLSSPWRDEFISNPDHRFAHGGILATLLDTAGSYAVATLLGRPAQTIDMRVDFLRPGFESELMTDANVLHFGRTVASVDASVFNRENRLLATGRMVFLTSGR